MRTSSKHAVFRKVRSYLAATNDKPIWTARLPAGCAFGDKGPGAFAHSEVNASVLLGLLTSRPARLLLSVRLGAGDDAPGSASKSYEVGLIRDLPFPSFTHEQAAELAKVTDRCVDLVRSRVVEEDETTACFVRPMLTGGDSSQSIREAVADLLRHEKKTSWNCAEVARIDEIACEALEFSDTDKAVMWEELQMPVTAFELESSHLTPTLQASVPDQGRYSRRLASGRGRSRIGRSSSDTAQEAGRSSRRGNDLQTLRDPPPNIYGSATTPCSAPQERSGGISRIVTELSIWLCSWSLGYSSF